MADKIWVTAGGEKIKVSDMTDQHLVNAIQYMERMRQREIASMQIIVDTADTGGDMGQLMSNARGFYEDSINEHFHKAIDALEKELKRREIK